MTVARARNARRSISPLELCPAEEEEHLRRGRDAAAAPAVAAVATGRLTVRFRSALVRRLVRATFPAQTRERVLELHRDEMARLRREKRRTEMGGDADAGAPSASARSPIAESKPFEGAHPDARPPAPP